MYLQEDLDRALSKAKIDMMKAKNTTFVSTVMCSLEVFYDDTIPTACTNGKYIKLGTKFFMDLPEKQRTFLLAHETMHVVYQHMLRRGDRDPMKHNAAADYVINLELVNQGLVMPSVGLIDPVYEGMSTEEVYELLPDSIDNPMDGDLEEGDPNESSETASEIQDMIVRAVQITDMREAGGSVPESIRRMIIQMAKPKVNWKVVLRRFMMALDKSDYSWARPNKRFTDIYMPHIRDEESLSKISFAIDTSGSVSENQFTQFISEVHGVFKTTTPRELELIQFDHILQSVDSIKSINQLSKVKFTGHGGTYPEVVIQHFITSKSEALIVLTDGGFHTEQLTKPRQPVIWVIFNNPDWKQPYGKVIHINIRN